MKLAVGSPPPSRGSSTLVAWTIALEAVAVVVALAPVEPLSPFRHAVVASITASTAPSTRHTLERALERRG